MEPGGAVGFYDVWLVLIAGIQGELLFFARHKLLRETDSGELCDGEEVDYS